MADKERLAARLEELGMGRPTVRERSLLFSGERTQLLHAKIALICTRPWITNCIPIFAGNSAGC